MESIYNIEIRKLLCEELGTVYHVEGLFLRSLPRLATAATAPELKQWFQQQIKHTQQQMTRLQKIFKLCEKETREKKCESMLSLMVESKRAMDRWKNSAALDATLLCLAQKMQQQHTVEYHNLCAWAEILEEREIGQLLAVSLEEEEAATKELRKKTPGILCADRVEA
jgi:ferritin-like metal-binding protein YciE